MQKAAISGTFKVANMKNGYCPPFINFVPSLFSSPSIIKEITDSRTTNILDFRDPRWFNNFWL